MNEGGSTGGIPTPFAPFAAPPKRPVIKHLDIQVEEHGHGSNQFLDWLALLALIIVGCAAAWAFNDPYPTGSIADWAASIAFLAWNLACAEAIIEHSKRRNAERSQKHVGQIIKEAIDHFNKA